MAITITAAKVKDRNTVETSEFPDATNTGPTGTLTDYVGDRNSISGNGVIIENQHIYGQVEFLGSGCILRNCIIETNGFWPVRFQATTGTPGLMEYCQVISGDNSQCSAAGGNWTMQYCDLSGSGDGVKTGDNSIIQYNWIHDLGGDETAHRDCVEMTASSNVTVQYNTLLNFSNETSCMMIGRNGGVAPSNVLVQGNLMAGGGYCIYGPEDISPQSSNIRILNNKFWDLYYPGTFGFYGAIANWAPSGSGNQLSGNTNYLTGATVTS